MELLVRRVRQQRGWSQTFLSGRTGIASTDISRLERGIVPAWPGWRRRISEAFQLPEIELFAPIRCQLPGARR